MDKKEELQKQADLEKRDIQSLRSGNRRSILETIAELRNRGSISILDEIFELMLITLDAEIMEACIMLLNDIKDKEAIPILIDAITEEKYLPIQKELVAACWQNGLDYHEYLKVFVDVAVHADYATTIEAYTVIESCIGEAKDDTRKKSIEILKQSLKSIAEDKTPLVRELISMLERFQN